MKLTTAPHRYRFLDSLLFIVNSSRFGWVSLVTEKNVIHKFQWSCGLQISSTVVNSSRLLRVSLATGKIIC